MTNVVRFQGKQSAPPIQMRSVDDFVEQDFPKQHYIISEGILIVGGKMIVGALKGRGKTIILFQMGYEIASGMPFLGKFDIPEPKRVGIFQKEVIDSQLADRLTQTRQRYAKLNPDNLLIPNVQDIEKLRLDTPDGIKLLRDLIIYYRLEVVLLDPVVWFHSLDEDKSIDVKKILRPVDSLIQELGCTFVISHHFKKPQMDLRTHRIVDQGLQDFRGSGVWGDWCDSAIWMNDRGNDKLLMESFLRHGKEQLDPMILTLDRRYAAFDAEIQDQPTTSTEFLIIQMMSKMVNQECLYDELVKKLVAQKIPPRTANVALSSLRASSNLYYVGTNGNRVVRLLSPHTRMWLR